MSELKTKWPDRIEHSRLTTGMTEEPMPEIVKPSWAKSATTFPANREGFYVTAFGEGASLKGPERKSEREAILAFNELFGDKS